jgi:hypothetical protein
MNYILEHPRRGFVVATPGDRDEKFHFAWAKPRSEALWMTRRQAEAWLQHPACPPDTYLLRWNEKLLRWEEKWEF